MKKNISKKIEEILSQSESSSSGFGQIAKFEETLKNLQKIAPINKPVYNLPQTDTIGKQTYSSLNRK
jgi:hypothetical protein